MRVAHLSSAHQRYDTRIYKKMCSSLSRKFNMVLIVADDKGNEVTKNNVTIIDIGKAKSRISRFYKTTRLIYLEAIKLDYDLYHLHDPELIPVGVKLKKLGKKVIFDAHEDLPKQLLGKPYLNVFFRRILSICFSLFEKAACKNFDSIVTATPAICKKFKKINKNTNDINNYPLLDELSNSMKWENKASEVSYVGGISRIRGINQLISAMDHTSGIKLNLAGNFNEKKLIEDVQNLPGWSKVDFHGYLDREGVRLMLSRSVAGLVTFLPSPNHIDAQPNKMFEYMSAGIPIVTSFFPLWREIVEGNECGICIDPNRPDEIGEAIQYLIDNPEESRIMGERGRFAIEKKYNWKIEEKKLFNIYRDLLA